MTTTNDVYRKIKEMSARSVNPRPQIIVQQLANELSMGSDQLIPCLDALKEMRLIKAEGFGKTVKLTLLGSTVNR